VQVVELTAAVSEEDSMARAVLPHELDDPDFAWLINTYRENHPQHLCIEIPSQPVVFIGPFNNQPAVRRTDVPLALPTPRVK